MSRLTEQHIQPEFGRGSGRPSRDERERMHNLWNAEGDDAPERERSLVGEESGTTSWEAARNRLANPEEQRTSWLATTRPGGRPQAMPVIAFWIDGAIHIVAGEGTRKARNLAADGRCVIASSATVGSRPFQDQLPLSQVSTVSGDCLWHIG
jgi:Pyridoxamine 5'-phosphate oxidase